MKRQPPSILHLARLWRPTPEEVATEILDTWSRTPTFSYRLLYMLITKALQGSLPYSQFEQAILENESRASVQKILLEVLPHLYSHFQMLNPGFVQPIDQRSYVISNNLIVPFNPPLIFGDQTQTVLPWFLFWKSNPLGSDQIALASTLAIDLIEQDPDLAGADFSLYDFAVPKGEEERRLRITRRGTLRQLSERTRDEMLEIFVLGYELAIAKWPALKAVIAERKQQNQRKRPPSQPSPDLFA